MVNGQWSIINNPPQLLVLLRLLPLVARQELGGRFGLLPFATLVLFVFVAADQRTALAHVFGEGRCQAHGAEGTVGVAVATALEPAEEKQELGTAQIAVVCDDYRRELSHTRRGHQGARVAEVGEVGELHRQPRLRRLDAVDDVEHAERGAAFVEDGAPGMLHRPKLARGVHATQVVLEGWISREDFRLECLLRWRQREASLRDSAAGPLRRQGGVARRGTCRSRRSGNRSQCLVHSCQSRLQ